MNTTTKKLTAKQLERRLSNAVIHIDRTKETKSVYFTDKGLRLTVNEEYAIVETGFHRHLFDAVTSNGVSRPYIYIKGFVDLALARLKDIEVSSADGSNGYSYKKLLTLLKQDEKQNNYIIAFYVDMWLFTIFQNLYAIGETEIEAFMVYISYVCGIARNSIMLGEHKDGLTNKQFIELFTDEIKKLTADNEERNIFKPLTKEELVNENISATEQNQVERFFGNSINESNKE